MKPISREAVVERRQPYIRWSAVFAGAVLALGLWNLFNLLFVGGALTAIDADEVDRVHAVGVGTSIGSVLAPLLAMFVGGLAAGRLGSHYDRRVSAAHGALVWAIASIAGIVIMVSVIGNLGDRRAMMGPHDGMGRPAPGMSSYVDDQLRLLNQHLKAQNAPEIDKADFLDAARYAAGEGTAGVNRDAFVSRLDANTKLSRPEVEAAYERLGNNAPDVIVAAQQLALHRVQVTEAAEATGNALLAAGVALFLCLVTSIAGSIIGARILARRGGPGYERPDTLPGTQPAHTTAPYPASTATPVDPSMQRDLE